MTISAERFFMVEVRFTAPHLAALDATSDRLERQLKAAVPGGLSGVKVDAVSVEQVRPWGDAGRFERIAAK